MYDSPPWAEKRISLLSGCDKCSPECDNCWMFSMVGSHQNKKMLLRTQPERFKDFPKIAMHKKDFDKVGKRDPQNYFIAEMSDLFHDDVPVEFIQEWFKIMHDNPQHTFQLLKKRSGNMLKYTEKGLIEWPSNVWAGVTAGIESSLWRVDHLRKIPAALRFISIEPLLGPMPNINLEGIGWVVIGKENVPRGQTPRPTDSLWIEGIIDKCFDAKIPVWMKAETPYILEYPKGWNFTNSTIKKIALIKDSYHSMIHFH
jgi:protein gp37